MALNIFAQYDPRVNPPDADYPTGSLKDKSTPTSNDGTPLTVAWGNDYVGFTDALLAAADITHSGNPDTALNSQRLQALITLINNANAILPVTGGSTLTVNRSHILLDDAAPYTLPDTTGLSDGAFVEITRVSGAITPLINVDGTNSETISLYRPVDGSLQFGPDTSIELPSFLTVRAILVNGNWEI